MCCFCDPRCHFSRFLPRGTRSRSAPLPSFARRSISAPNQSPAAWPGVVGSEVIRTRHTSPRGDSYSSSLPSPCPLSENPEAGRHMENDQTVDHLYHLSSHPCLGPLRSLLNPRVLSHPALARGSIIDEQFPHSNRVESIYTYYIRNVYIHGMQRDGSRFVIVSPGDRHLTQPSQPVAWPFSPGRASHPGGGMNGSATRRSPRV